MSNIPYQQSLNAYLSAGWEGVLPLPPKSKFAPPKGFTGRNGSTPTEEDFMSWVERGGNVALRMPQNVIGLDVDSYGTKIGQKTIKELEARLGALPATWTSSRHENLDNGRTMLFRVPEGTKFVSGVKDVDVLQFGHRYLTAPPSIHPSGAIYYWYAPSGHKVEDLYPEVDDIAELPQAWLEELTEKEVPEENVILGDVEPWDSNLSWLPGGTMCSTMKDKVSYYIKGMKTCTSRHDWTVKAVMALIYAAVKGHAGITPALDELRTRFVQEVADDRGIKVAVHEFDSIVSWAVTQIHTKNFGISSKTDPCKSMRSFTARKSGNKTYYKRK